MGAAAEVRCVYAPKKDTDSMVVIDDGDEVEVDSPPYLTDKKDCNNLNRGRNEMLARSDQKIQCSSTGNGNGRLRCDNARNSSDQSNHARNETGQSNKERN